jgi:hypothetical protein
MGSLVVERKPAISFSGQMGGSLPNFGSIDLELDEPGAAPSPARRTAPPRTPVPRRTPSFGELDLESIGAALAEAQDASESVLPTEAAAPASTTRFPSGPPRETPTPQSLEAVRLAEEETRIAHAGVLSAAISQSVLDADDSTRVVNDAPSSSRNVPSASGVASRDDRVAAMRELYAEGNAAAALALASEVASELGADPFGGLIPVDDESAAGDPIEVVVDDDDDHTAIVEASADSSRLAAMTSRQIPRLLVDPREISRLPMDPRAAFLLGHIDGVQSMEEILDVCAMPESDALELIERLRRMGVIAIH